MNFLAYPIHVQLQSPGEGEGQTKREHTMAEKFSQFDENYNLLYELTDEDFDPEYNAVCLGDTVICYDKICEQAEEYGHSVERELAYLTAHSIYHLLGYDHITDELKKVMRQKEEEVLKDLNESN